MQTPAASFWIDPLLIPMYYILSQAQLIDRLAQTWPLALLASTHGAPEALRCLTRILSVLIAAAVGRGSPSQRAALQRHMSAIVRDRLAEGIAMPWADGGESNTAPLSRGEWELASRVRQAWASYAAAV